MALHRAASEGYRGAELYERARPDYPEGAVTWLAQALGLGPGRRALELGAGTGKLSRALTRHGGMLVAVEPVSEMRSELALRAPSALAVGGLAEAIPLRSGSVGAVLCAQSFHWFAGPRAIGEIHRVLAPGGVLGLVWNQRDERVGWVRQLGEVLLPLQGDAPRFRSGRWRDALSASALFGPLEERRFAIEQAGAPEAVVERISSTSFVAALPAARRLEVLGEVRRIVAAGAQEGRVRMPYVTHAFCCERR
ncbi:MAG TPA: class I SAM-dependent methyltransferase [Anaeromyxobacteraceae bacterium]|nr:class I SAM-dependent methyltransferase [Anaeromyxobacteraceae bacterium]